MHVRCTHQRRMWPLLLCLAALGAALQAQNASFEASAEPAEIVLGDYFELRFTLRNARGTHFVPPDLSAFDVLMGPSQSFRTTIINGQTSSEFSITYTLRPRRPGSWTIGPARIRAQGRTLQSNSVRVRVRPPLPGPDEGGAQPPQMFVEVVLSDTVAWTGQEIIAELKLYTTRDVDSYSILEEPELKGAWVEPLRRFDTRVRREMRRGVQYATKVLRRMAIFPQQTGRLEIPAWRLQLGVVDRRQGGMGFFFNTRVTPVVVESAPRHIEVRPLPPGAPPSFTGAVGRFAVQTHVQPTSLTTDDALRITWTISGVGDVKRIDPPVVPLSADSFDLYEPRIVEETIYEDRGLLRGKKVIEVLAIPRYAGWYRIVPSFAWFDTDSLTYREVEPKPWFVEVKPGQGRARSRLAAPAHPADTLLIHPFAATTRLRARARPSLWGSPAFYLLSLLPFALGLIGGAVWRWQQRRPPLTPAELRHRKARKLARQRLAQAERLLQQRQYRAFYEALSRALVEYVAWRLHIPFAQLSKAQMATHLAAQGVPEDLRKRYLQLLDTCHKALYAGMAEQLPHQALRQEAEALISELEPYLET